MSKSVGSLGEILKQNGYNTSWFGKNHNVPDFQTSQAGPFDLWPTGLGFEYFYGFLGADANQWAPAIYEGTKPVEPPYDDPNYHFDVDLADHAINYIRQQQALAPDKPFFVYYAPGTHTPHHAPKEWIDKFKGKFDQGFNQVRQETFERQKQLGVIPADTQLTPWPKEIPEWNTFSPQMQKLLARQMEVYAAALAYCDYQIGRVIDAVAETGELDNTLIIFIQGDNGASAEAGPNGLTNEVGVLGNGVIEDEAFLISMIDEWGGPKTINHYSIGWAHTMNTPFQWDKKIASHFGGTRNGLVISYPKRIKDAGGLRSQFHHVIDITPTILDVVGLPAPTSINGVEQKPMEGVSLAYTFDKANAPTAHQTQYFEIVANRAIYNNGWIAATTPKRLPWVSLGETAQNPAEDFDWELYHEEKDFSEAVNLAKSNPQKLEEMKNIFWQEAEKYNVLPIDDRYGERGDVSSRPSLTRGRNSFTYYDGTVRVTESAAPDLKNRSYSITADVEIPSSGASGILATQGGRFGGWGFFLQNNQPIFVHAFSNQEKDKYKVASATPLTPGQHTVRFDFQYDGGGLGKGGTGIISVDGQPVAKGRIEQTIPRQVSFDETFDIGEDTGTPVIDDYSMPFNFTGELNKVTLDVQSQQTASPSAVVD